MVVISGHVGSSNLIPDHSIFISMLLSHWFQWPDGRRKRHITVIIWYMWAPVAFPLYLPGLSFAICTTGQALCCVTPSTSPWSSLLRFHLITIDVSEKILHVMFYVPFWHVVIGFLTANHHVQNWKDCSCKINFFCIYPGVGIRSQPKSSIINPLLGKKKKKEKVSICLQGSIVFQAPSYCFPQHAGAARFLTAVLILSVAGLFADSVIVYPPSFPPSLLPSFLPFLSYFLFLFLQYGGK